MVAEVIFPNTIPPFFPKSSLASRSRRRRAGRRPRACAGPACRPTTAGWPTSAPQPRAAGPASPRSCCTTSTRRGRDPLGRRRRADRRRPAARCPPGIGLPPLLRAGLRAHLDDVRGARRAGQPPQRQRGRAHGPYPEARVMFLLEVTWWAHRGCGTSSFGGALERHPDLQFVFTEQGTAWCPRPRRSSTTTTPGWGRRRLAGGQRFGPAGGEQGCRCSRASTGLASATVGASFIRARRGAASRSVSTGSCGAATIRTRNRASPSPERRSG